MSITYYIEQNGEILLYDTDKTLFMNSYNDNPDFAGLEIKETERPIENFQFADTEEYKQEKAQKRQGEFEKEFFLTSLGYIRRNVNMSNGSTKDFICDIVPALTNGLALGIATPIITYKQPDFTQEFTLEYMESLQEIKPVTAEFLKECSLQLAADFMPQGLTISPVEPADTNSDVDTDTDVETDNEESEVTE